MCFFYGKRTHSEKHGNRQGFGRKMLLQQQRQTLEIVEDSSCEAKTLKNIGRFRIFHFSFFHVFHFSFSFFFNLSFFSLFHFSFGSFSLLHVFKFSIFFFLCHFFFFFFFSSSFSFLCHFSVVRAYVNDNFHLKLNVFGPQWTRSWWWPS